MTWEVTKNQTFTVRLDAYVAIWNFVTVVTKFKCYKLAMLQFDFETRQIFDNKTSVNGDFRYRYYFSVVRPKDLVCFRDA